MKLQHFLIIILLLGSKILSAQVAINTDGSAPDPSAMLDVSSTSKGLLLPSMTTNQRRSIASPDEGLMVFNTGLNMWQYYNGTNWSNCDGTSCAPATPGAISGITAICSGNVETYSISAVTAATSYNWTVPTTSSISSGQGTTSITVTFGTTSGNVSVRAENDCGGSSYNDMAVAVSTDIPSQPGDISGNTLPLTNATETYSIAAVADATSYSWTVPTDASITSGQGTTSINVNYGTNSGNVSVFASNACGNSSTTELVVTLFACGDVYTDSRDNKTYNTVSINGQCWFAENLNIGSMISGSTNQTNNTSIEKYCFDNNATNCDTYGGLYQWDEMMQYVTNEGTQGICPDGWHIPTDTEWTTLTNYAGGQYVAGGKLKETGTTHWLTPNAGATNEYGFTNLPAGYHNSDGNFHFQTTFSYTWSSATQTTNTDNAWARRLQYDFADLENWAYSKEWGFSVRCIKN